MNVLIRIRFNKEGEITNCTVDEEIRNKLLLINQIFYTNEKQDKKKKIKTEWQKHKRK